MSSAGGENAWRTIMGPIKYPSTGIPRRAKNYDRLLSVADVVVIFHDSIISQLEMSLEGLDR
jgi:hypothetical protein